MPIACCAKLVGAILMLACAGLMCRIAGQQLEPRAYSVSPVGTNIVVFGYGRSTGDIAFDPSLPITDARAAINAASAGYFQGSAASVSGFLPGSMAIYRQ